MAFGKNPDQLANIPAWGGNALQHAKALARRDIPQTGGGGGKGMPYWKSLFILPDTHSTIVRLIPGDYEQQVSYDRQSIVTQRLTHVRFIEHHNGRRGCICSGGPLWNVRSSRLECPSCEQFWEDVVAKSEWKKAKKAGNFYQEPPQRMSATKRFAYNTWDYGLYYEIPDLDANRQVRMNPRTGKPYSTWVAGSPNDPKFQGYPWKQGHLLPWAMPDTYHEALLDLEKKKIGTFCVSCGSMGSIQAIMRTCGFCGQFIYDPNNCTLTEEQRNAIDDYPYTCPHCGKIGFTTEQIRCTQCQKPKRATLFDVDLEVTKVGQKGTRTFVQVLSVSNPRPIQVSDPNVLSTIKPMNLLRRFAPTTPEAQRQMFGLSARVQPLPAPSVQMQMGAPQGAPQGMPQMGMPPMQMPAPMQMPQPQPQVAYAQSGYQAPLQTPMQPSMPWQPAMSMSQQPQMGMPSPMQPPAVPYTQPAMQVPVQAATGEPDLEDEEGSNE